MIAKQRNPKSVCSRIGLALTALVVVVMISFLFMYFLVTMLAPELINTTWLLLLLNHMSLYVFGLPVFLLILHFVPNGPEQAIEKKPFGFGKYLMVLIFSLGTMYLFGFISQFFVTLVELLKQRPVMDNLEGISNLPLALEIFFLAVVPGVGEEFIFRYMLRKKMRGSRDLTYMVMSALCFAVFHLNLAQFIYTFFMGMTMAWLYLRTNKIWLCMIAHGVLNIFGGILIPWLGAEYPIIGFSVIGFFIVGAIVVFALSIQKIYRGLKPAYEPGWPGYESPAPVTPGSWPGSAPPQGNSPYWNQNTGYPGFQTVNYQQPAYAGGAAYPLAGSPPFGINSSYNYNMYNSANPPAPIQQPSPTVLGAATSPVPYAGNPVSTQGDPEPNKWVYKASKDAESPPQTPPAQTPVAPPAPAGTEIPAPVLSPPAPGPWTPPPYAPATLSPPPYGYGQPVYTPSGPDPRFYAPYLPPQNPPSPCYTCPWGQGQAAQPSYPPYPGYGYGLPFYGTAPKAKNVCFANVGMIIYLSVGALMIFFNLLQ